ncbi:hypothetical protein J4449_02865 [Candidatus Woesearchaeota archaeon]|nr:hypothetical protein [Candidatus Woesearchaeota archaeon]
MPQRLTIASGLKIKQRSVFNLDELYKVMFRWFELYGYDMQELEYRDSIEGNAKHLEIKWKATKRIDDYLQYIIITNFLILGLESVEIEQDGTKTKTNKGEVEINLTGFLEKDYEDKWESGYSRVIRDIYDKYVIHGRIDSLSGELYEEIYKLIDEVKAFLNLHRF